MFVIGGCVYFFVLWMGGDCDGNFNVIVWVMCEVLLLVCWMVVDLYLCDVDYLVVELSMQ